MPKSTENPTRNCRVLVAEDETLIRLDLVETLTGLGYSPVAEAENGEKAVELARQIPIDVAIMDIQMPKQDGISAAEIIISERLAPVVFLTAFSQSELIERAQKAGAMAYVVKPFTPDELVPAIEIARSRHDEILALESEVTDIKERLETRILVDRAKSRLIEKMGLSEPEAFRWIQKTAMDRRLGMRDVAQTVLDQVD